MSEWPPDIGVTPYYSDSATVIYHGDCRDILPLLPKVDLVLTDPPYGVDKAKWDKDFPEWCPRLCLSAAPVVLMAVGSSTLPGALRACGDSYRDVLCVYLKNGMTLSKTAFGNWFPVLVLGDVGWKPRRSIIESTVIPSQTPDGHPSPKPLDAWRKVLAWSVGDTVLDPFMGSGTTLRAAKDLGRRAIGIEISEEYCAIARDRLAQEVLAL